jgi:YD repeat-containing protein
MVTPRDAAASFEYDRAGNIIKQPDAHQIEVGDGNRVRNWGRTTFDYDERNHVSAIHDPKRGSARFAYDSRGFLTTVNSLQPCLVRRVRCLGRRIRVRKRSFAARVLLGQQNRLAAEVSELGRVRLYIYVDALAIVPFMFIDLDSVQTKPATWPALLCFL